MAAQGGLQALKTSAMAAKDFRGSGSSQAVFFQDFFKIFQDFLKNPEKILKSCLRASRPSKPQQWLQQAAKQLPFAAIAEVLRACLLKPLRRF